MGRIYVNNFSTSTNGAITDSATTIVISSSTGLPTLGSGEYYYLTLGSGASVEIVKVTARSTFTLTVVRAQEGTTGVAWASGTAVEMRATADSFTQKQDQVANATDVINFGDAVSLELPNNATATLSAAGQICLDTSVTDYADGVLCYRAGSTDYGIVAIPKADLASPTDTYTVTYDAATDKFKLAAGGGGGSYTGTANQIDVTAGIISLIADGNLPGAGGWHMSVGSSGSRGSNSVGRFRYNTSTGYVEFNDSSGWFDLLSTYSPVTVAQGGTGVSALPKIYISASADAAIATATATKVLLNTEVIDSNSNFDSATNYRFTPTVAGNYLIGFSATWETAAATYSLRTYIYKNGAPVFTSFIGQAFAVSGMGQDGTVILNMNGSTDYVEMYVYQDSGSNKTLYGDASFTKGTVLYASLLP